TLPSLLTNERYKFHIREIFAIELRLAFPCDPDEFLSSRMLANGDDEPPADSELLFQRLRDYGRARRDKNGIERSKLGPAPCSIRALDMDICVAGFRQICGGAPRQLFDALDRVNIFRNLGEDGSGIARSRADLQNPFTAFE